MLLLSTTFWILSKFIPKVVQSQCDTCQTHMQLLVLTLFVCRHKGVLQVWVLEAKELHKQDIGGKADPFVQLQTRLQDMEHTVSTLHAIAATAHAAIMQLAHAVLATAPAANMQLVHAVLATAPAANMQLVHAVAATACAAVMQLG